MRRVLPILVTVPTLCLTAYLLWADFRVDVLYDQPAVLVWPHSDRWIVVLYEWYDKRNPVDADHFKIHGEIPRVGATVRTMLAFSGMLSGFVAAVVIRRARDLSGGRVPPLPQFSLRSLMLAIAVITLVCWAAPRVWGRPWGYPFRLWHGWVLAILAAAAGAFAGKILTWQSPSLKSKS